MTTTDSGVGRAPAPRVVPATAFTVVAEARCSLGEGPTWDDARGVVRWVDIDHGHLWEAPLTGDHLGPARIVVDCGAYLGAAVHAEDGGLLLARTGHLEHRDASGTTVGCAALIPDGVASRLNDGACDPAGRYLVGSLAQDGRTGAERLWRLEHDGTVTVLDEDLTLSNGMGWSPDGSLMYQIDTVPGTLYVRDYDVETGAAGRRRVLVEIRDASPDGLTVDARGHVWVAIWGAGEVRRYSPTGDLLETLRTGAPLTTSCQFAGPALDLLVVTTAGKAENGVTQTERGGTVLALRSGAVGQPTTPWRPAPLGPA
jgi:sugar lactone lactonase YvrE